jgi:hypothetical protein
LVSWELGLPSRNPCDTKDSEPHRYRNQLQGPAAQAKKPGYNKASVNKYAAAEKSIEMPTFLAEIVVSMVWGERITNCGSV